MRLSDSNLPTSSASLATGSLAAMTTQLQQPTYPLNQMNQMSYMSMNGNRTKDEAYDAGGVPQKEYRTSFSDGRSTHEFPQQYQQPRTHGHGRVLTAIELPTADMLAMLAQKTKQASDQYVLPPQQQASQPADTNDHGAAMASRTQSRQSSWSAAQSYREFLNSTLTSAATSAASSVAASRVASRTSSAYSSAYSSAVVSAASSQTNSPRSITKKHDEREPGEIIEKQPTQSPQYFETIFPTAPSTVVAQGNNPAVQPDESSTISFQNLVLRKSDSQDSLDEPLAVHYRGASRPRPNHFTFSENDIMKSFMRAAERDRLRAEREAERQREARARADKEEFERQRQKAFARAAADRAAYAAQFQATVGYPLPAEEVSTSECSSNDSAPATRKRRFVPVPRHFRFTSHDVQKSASKPVQQQKIGHWTTFPRSSTVVITAHQLKTWIATLLDRQRDAEREKLLQQRHHSSAPASPRRKLDQPPKHVTNGTNGHSALLRRSSLPLVHEVQTQRTTNSSAKPPTPPQANRGATPAAAKHTHTRSRSLNNQLALEKDNGISGNEKLGNHYQTNGVEKMTTTRQDSIQDSPQIQQRTSVQPRVQQQSAAPPVKVASHHSRSDTLVMPGHGLFLPHTASTSGSVDASPNQTAYARCSSLGNGETKSGSATNSPVVAGQFQVDGNLYPNQSVGFSPYDRSLQTDLSRPQNGISQQPIVTKSYVNPLYRDVPSSGYGQQRASVRPANGRR